MGAVTCLSLSKGSDVIIEFVAYLIVGLILAVPVLMFGAGLLMIAYVILGPVLALFQWASENK